MNEQNLIPQNKRTKSEQTEIAKKGGHSYTQSVEDIYQLKENYKIKIQR